VKVAAAHRVYHPNMGQSATQLAVYVGFSNVEGVRELCDSELFRKHSGKVD
jgi:hypothetical protein